MKLQAFIATNRKELNQAINAELYRHDGRGGRGTIPNPPPQHSSSEIRQWILNDEGLYRWARAEGVRI